LEKNDNNFGSEKLAMKGKDFQGTKPAKKNKYFQEKFISSVCPSCVEMVKNSFPELKKFLMPFDSPMGAMAKILKKNFPEHKIVFLSPCSAKKLEASKLVDKNGKKLIEGAITFAEMRQIIAKEKPVAKNVSHKFDAFYNDYTKIYPLAGGLCGSLHYENILKKEHVVSCDGVKDLEELLKKHSDKVLLDILFCRGGCIGGPGVRNPLPLFLKKQRVLSYVKVAAREKMDGNEGLDKYSKGIDFGKKF
jgi:iron only hydrogenase large subunit-like protein